MADDITLNRGTGGAKIASRERSGKHFQRIILIGGDDNSDHDVNNPLAVSQVSEGSVKDIFSRYLDTTGDGTGTKNAIGNYSGGATDFKIVPPAGTVYRVERMLVTLEDTSGFTSAEYGNTGAALSNGVIVQKKNGGGVVLDLTDNIPITTNAEWGRTCYDVELKTWGAGNEFLLARWTFSKAGKPIRLDGDSGEYLAVTLEDDCSGLVQHYFLVQGYTE